MLEKNSIGCYLFSESTKGRYFHVYLLFKLILHGSTTNEHTGQLLPGSNALWPTKPKFWVGAVEFCTQLFLFYFYIQFSRLQSAP